MIAILRYLRECLKCIAIDCGAHYPGGRLVAICIEELKKQMDIEEWSKGGFLMREELENGARFYS